MYIFWIFILVTIFFITCKTFSIGKEDNHPLFKAKLKVNGIEMAGYYKIIPDKEMKFYNLDKKQINEENNRVSVVELLDSSVTNWDVDK